MEYEAIRLRNRKHVRFISWIDMLIAILMIAYFSYKFILSDLNDVTRPPFSPGRGFAEFLFTSICIVYSTQFFIAVLLLTSTNRSEKLENACVKCQIWICISHFLLTTLATELFILGFNLIRPGATTEQTVTFSIATVICLLKTGFRIFAERSVKEYLRDIYSVPGVQFSDSMYFAPRHLTTHYAQNYHHHHHHHHHLCNHHQAIVDDNDDQDQDNYQEEEEEEEEERHNTSSPYRYSPYRARPYYDYDYDEYDYEYDEDNVRDYRDRRYEYDVV
ncbi:unnamed protein product [Orchesella dallaii]|uniref:Uncharacterized protein n=1 Tax=Orchesella dallaii TaxID=48710 RepID=A0ABP1Q979_9HEXA